MIDTKGKLLYRNSASDGKYLFTCTPENGWEIDNSCFNDFTTDKDFILNIPLNYINTPEHIDINLTNITEATCGECSAESMPPFCVEDGGGSWILHKCENGRTRIGEDNDACSSVTNRCFDDYNQPIYVNTDDNRNHCGGCNNKCASHQNCSSGTCNSAVRIDDCTNDYFTFNAGSRFIRAYCIKDSDELAKIGSRYPNDNYDNAYILVFTDPEKNTSLDAISLEAWEPIGLADDIPFNGMLFGNGKTITIKKFKIDEKYYERDRLNIGLFSKVENAYVTDLTLVYSDASDLSYGKPNSDNDIIDFSIFNGTLMWSVLAGFTENSTIRNIVIKDSIAVFKNDVIFPFIGMLTGRVNNSQISNITLNNIQINDNPYNDMVDYGEFIGGLTGYAEDTLFNSIHISDSSIRSHSEHIISYTGSAVGYMSCQDDNTVFNHSIEISNVNLSGFGSVGGFSATDYSCNFDNVSLSNMYILGNSSASVGGISAYITDSMINNIQISNNRLYANSYGSSGGLANNINNSDISNIKIADCDIQSGDYAGGLARFCTASSINHITLTGNRIEGRNGAGGVIGYKNGKVQINNVNTDDNSIQSANGDTGGLVGYSSGSDTLAITNAYMRNDKAKGRYVGGLIGYTLSDTVISFSSVNSKLLSGTSTGGLIGYSSGNTTINGTSVESTNLSGTLNTGGFIGYSNGGNLIIASSSAYSFMNSNKQSQSIGGFIGAIDDLTFKLHNSSSIVYANSGLSSIIKNQYALFGCNKSSTYHDCRHIDQSKLMIYGYAVSEYHNESSDVVNDYPDTLCETPSHCVNAGNITDSKGLTQFNPGVCSTKKVNCYYTSKSADAPVCSIDWLEKCFDDSNPYDDSSFYQHDLWAFPGNGGFTCNEEEFVQTFCSAAEGNSDEWKECERMREIVPDLPIPIL